MLKRLIVAVPLAGIGALWFFYLTLPWPVLLRARNPERTSFMELRIAQAQAKGDSLRIRHDWVPLSHISRNLRRAVVVAEDGHFYDHNGIDWGAIRDEVRYRGDEDFSWTSTADVGALLTAFGYYVAHRDRVRGRSTITMQLAKNLYFSEARSLSRKLGEFFVARRLEWFLSKDRILELYLNVVEWGPGVFGAEAAAQYYFDKAANQLSPDEAAALAATLPHPLTSNPKLRPGRMAWRKRMILALLGSTGSVRTVPLEPLPIIPDSTKQTVQSDSVRPDSVRRDSLPPDTLRPDTLRKPDTLRSIETSRAH